MASELETYEMSIDEGRIVSERIAGGAWMNAHEAIAAITALESERDQWKARAESNKPPAGHIIDDQGVVRKVLGTLPLTADGCVVGQDGCVYYLGETARGDHVVMPSEWPPLRWENAYAPSECYSTEDACRCAVETRA